MSEQNNSKEKAATQESKVASRRKFLKAATTGTAGAAIAGFR